MKTMVDVIGEDDLFPVNGQWCASSYILIYLFHIPLHKAEREREGEREREREGQRGGNRKKRMKEWRQRGKRRGIKSRN